MEMEATSSYEKYRESARQDAIEEELYGHPGIQTPEQKTQFIRNAFGVTEEELIIDTTNETKLDTTFAFASFLERRTVKGKLPEEVRNKGEKFGGKNLLEALQQGDVLAIFDHYIEAFDWNHTG